MNDINHNEETINFCGVEWIKEGTERKSHNSDFHTFTGYLHNDNIGSLYITANAFLYLKDKTDMHYKVLSLIYELSSTGKHYSLGEDDKDLLNGQQSNDDFIVCTVDKFLQRFPTNFIEIQQRALITIYGNYPNYGQFIKNFEEYHLFAKDNPEMGFILSSLIKKELLDGDVLWNGDGSCRLKVPYRITVDGWLEIEKSIHSNNSKQVFIAMSFHENMKSVRTAIKKAILDTNYVPVVIDEIEHVNYIPLEIQNKIKNCGLMIADFTTQNHGAYFEAGYAMGLNIPVIWCCSDTDSKNLHFDIRQYNNILWQNEEDLYNRLVKRLNALKE